MASSRIFVKGLPPTFTEEEFRNHFAKQQSITDAKLLPHRRIGYVGYKSPEDAAKAVKYFNKSFIRMSRIWVEIARPVSDQSLPKSRRSTKYEHQHKDVDHTATSITPSENPLKRKRAGPELVESDPKLKEFLEVMQPPSKAKTWKNEQVQDVDGVMPLAEDIVHGAESPEGGSDDEYQVVSKKSKRVLESSEKPSKDSGRFSHNSENAPVQDNQQTAEDVKDVTEATEESIPSGGPVSDADWLRSRTSRLLGLEDDNDGPTKPPVPHEDEATSNEIADNDAHRKDASKSPEPHGDHRNGQDVDEEESDANENAARATGRLFLRNLSYDLSEDDLRSRFQSFGSLQEVHVPVVASSRVGKGFAYIQFDDPESAVQALKEVDGTIFQGRLVHILPAAAKRETKLDEFAISKLPLKKQKQIQRKAGASSSTFNWNALYMNADSVMSSIADRLGVSKADLLDPTSADAGVKQAHAETHIISETKSFFAQHGVDLDAFKKRERGDTAILVKNFPYGTKADELRKLFEEHGQVSKLLMPPSGTIAIVEFTQAPEARSAFQALAYRKIKDSILFLEKAPKDLFKEGFVPLTVVSTPSATEKSSKLSASDLLQKDTPIESTDTATLFVRNLNFSTTSARLTEVFKPLEGFMSARVTTKFDPKRPSESLSAGYGFLEFRTKAQAQAALAAMDGYNLDGHNLLIKASHKGLDAAEERRKEDRAKKAAGKRTKLIIKNLPFQASKQDVRALLGPYGQLRSVRVPKTFNNTARGFAFAEFTTPREAENVIDALRNTHLLGRKLVLDYAAEDPEDAEEELEKMQKKVGSQVNKVALQRLTGGGRKKFNVAGNDNLDEA
ncbi:RNA-binding domain-containing protein [Glonium stellatum]|uniref:Multiple RNA-binding domain-containing protein 1 n=1 Tax=Glonium stellatum TaxID=574774 RepID=A0A8E2JWS5_9PEZI|nr:RNA-binding domain-containing protein [Glonium stellatum]